MIFVWIPKYKTIKILPIIKIIATKKIYKLILTNMLIKWMKLLVKL